MDAKTKEYLNEMGPTYHMTLLHHHNITCKLNNIDEPEDDVLVTFETGIGEYNIKYGKLKEFAAQEQEKFINEYGNGQQTL